MDEPGTMEIDDVSTEDEDPVMVGSPLVLVDGIDLFLLTFWSEYPDVEVEGSRGNVISSVTVNQSYKFKSCILGDKSLTSQGVITTITTDLGGHLRMIEIPRLRRAQPSGVDDAVGGLKVHLWFAGEGVMV